MQRNRGTGFPCSACVSGVLSPRSDPSARSVLISYPSQRACRVGCCLPYPNVKDLRVHLKQQHNDRLRAQGHKEVLSGFLPSVYLISDCVFCSNKWCHFAQSTKPLAAAFATAPSIRCCCGEYTLHCSRSSPLVLLLQSHTCLHVLTLLSLSGRLNGQWQNTVWFLTFTGLVK